MVQYLYGFFKASAVEALNRVWNAGPCHGIREKGDTALLESCDGTVGVRPFASTAGSDQSSDADKIKMVGPDAVDRSEDWRRHSTWHESSGASSSRYIITCGCGAAFVAPTRDLAHAAYQEHTQEIRARMREGAEPSDEAE